MIISWKVKVKSLSCVQLFVTQWTVAYQVPPSTGFSRQEYWSGLPFPSPGDLPSPGTEPGSPASYSDALPSELPGKSSIIWWWYSVIISWKTTIQHHNQNNDIGGAKTLQKLPSSQVSSCCTFTPTPTSVPPNPLNPWSSPICSIFL